MERKTGDTGLIGCGGGSVRPGRQISVPRNAHLEQRTGKPEMGILQTMLTGQHLSRNEPKFTQKLIPLGRVRGYNSDTLPSTN